VPTIAREGGKSGGISCTSPGCAHNRFLQNIQTWLQKSADEHRVALGPDANMPLWEGTRPDHDLAVSGLLAG